MAWAVLASCPAATHAGQQNADRSTVSVAANPGCPVASDSGNSLLMRHLSGMLQRR